MEAAATPGGAAGLSTLESIATLGVLPAGIPWAAEGGAPCARRSIAERLAEVLAAFAEPQRGAGGGGGAGADGAAAMDEDGGGRAAPPEFTAEQLCARLEGFAAPPFTMQRLCELLLEPRRHYRTLAKFTNACAKLLIVTDLIQLQPEPLAPELQAEVAVWRADVVAKDKDYVKRKEEDAKAAAAAGAEAAAEGPDSAALAAEVAAEEKWAGSTEAAAAAAVGGQGGEASGEDGAAKAANPTGDAPTGAEPAAAAAAAAPMAGAGPMDVAGD